MSNEAAERLRKRFTHEPVSHRAMELLDEALTAERRATVDYIRRRIAGLLFDDDNLDHALHILDDAEAER